MGESVSARDHFQQNVVPVYRDFFKLLKEDGKFGESQLRRAGCEAAGALYHMREHLPVLFPIRLGSFEEIRDWELFDADSGKDLAVEVREYFVPDFSHWKNHDAFENAFMKLLNSLSASDKCPS